eukprot:CAMPEP_0198725270 /NCGR_PEP_ID=MMETSP1475-20131203/2601_1 /TAXON_ID= ORGANISM="Unidentified sp., Strain CCMP1999" /NCGR_SAMPLE_ID=MMETSP1475 /ASSEMBLY_ACC=CAM_ASM_001111 /LENGTH=331 /DNA_ID=CAMNT_0044487013 /DNA_START=161 /DNA_END=1156 /DNA_ORIENTATION=+
MKLSGTCEFERTRLKWILLRGRHWSPSEVLVSSEVERIDHRRSLKYTRVVLFVRDKVAESQQHLTATFVESSKHVGRKSRPAVVVLHGTSGDRYSEMSKAENLAMDGIVAITADLRYHGERKKSPENLHDYHAALIRAFDNNVSFNKDDRNTCANVEENEYPFIYDNAADMIALADYLTERKDIDSDYLGITGVSLGGMVAWFAAATDNRWSFCSPMIGVQGFVFAIDNECFHGRVASLKPLFEYAAEQEEVTCETVRKVWGRVTPGLCEWFDVSTLSLLSPRPCLIMNGEADPRCPHQGVLEATKVAETVYAESGYPENLQVDIQHCTQI